MASCITRRASVGRGVVSEPRAWERSAGDAFAFAGVATAGIGENTAESVVAGTVATAAGGAAALAGAALAAVIAMAAASRSLRSFCFFILLFESPFGQRRKPNVVSCWWQRQAEEAGEKRCYSLAR